MNHNSPYQPQPDQPAPASTYSHAVPTNDIPYPGNYGQPRRSKTGLIVGIVVGALVLVTAVVVAILFLTKDTEATKPSVDDISQALHQSGDFGSIRDMVESNGGDFDGAMTCIAEKMHENFDASVLEDLVDDPSGTRFTGSQMKDIQDFSAGCFSRSFDY